MIDERCGNVAILGSEGIAGWLASCKNMYEYRGRQAVIL